MNNREAIEWLAPDTSKLKINMAELNGENPLKYINEAIDVAINALEEQDKRRWIPVSERLPERMNGIPYSERVLISTEMIGVVSAQYSFKENMWVDNACNVDGSFYEPDWYDESINVIAWQPLPSAYTI